MHPFAKALVEYFDEQLKNKAEAVAAGQATDFTDYKKRCEAIKTLRDARAHVIEEAKKDHE